MLMTEVSEMKYRSSAFGGEMPNSGATHLMPGFSSALRLLLGHCLQVHPVR